MVISLDDVDPYALVCEMTHIWDRVDDYLSEYDLWLETGERNGADVYICGGAI